MATSHASLRRATTSVLVAVALISGAILLLGDRFDRAGGYALGQPVHPEAHIAACVADESMRLINPDRERCHPAERELVSQPTDRPAPAELTMAGHGGPGLFCPAGKVVVGGGVLPDPDDPGKAGAPEDRMEVLVSAPLLPSDGGGYGWTATVKNTSGTSPLSVLVAAICLTLR